jgi:hypothetical protein
VSRRPGTLIKIDSNREGYADVAPTLQQLLLDPARRPDVVTELAALVDAEVADKSGVSGMAVKGGYSLVKKISPTFVPHALDSMLDEFVARMEPFHQEAAAADMPFSAYLASHTEPVAEALLGVTDDRAAASQRESLRKVYAKLRPQAHKHVTEALPRLGLLVEKYATVA